MFGCSAQVPGESGASGGSSGQAGSGTRPVAGVGGSGGQTSSGLGGDPRDATPPEEGATPGDAPSDTPAERGDAPVLDTSPADGSDAALSDAPPGKVTHRVLAGASDKGILAIVSADGQIEWQYNALALGGEANDAWLLPNGNVAFAYKAGAREMTADKRVVWDYPAPTGSEVHSCEPLPNGNYLIGEAHDGGVGFLREINSTGKVVSSITLNVPGGIAAHGQFREVRKTPDGTYLVTYLQLNQAMEFDATGKLLRTFPCGSFVAVRLPDGNTLIGCGDAHRVIEVDPNDKVVWEVTETEIAGNRLGFAAGVQRLPNGNTVICNYPGHFAVDPHEPQAFELTRDKKLVWELQNAALGWTSNVEILDADAQLGGAVLR